MMKTLVFVIFMLSAPFSSFAQSSVDIPNFREVNSHLYRGGNPSIAGLQYLAKLGVKTVIDLQGGDLDSDLSLLVRFAEPGELPSAIAEESKEVSVQRMIYRNYPLDSIDDITPAESAEIQKILADIRNPDLQPVFIHCQHGNDRTGLIVALERVDDEHWSAARAYQEWVADGHSQFSQLLTGGLDDYFAQMTAQF